MNEVMKYVRDVLELIVDVGAGMTAESMEIFAGIFNSTVWLKTTAETFLERNESPFETVYVVTVSMLVVMMFIWCVLHGSQEALVTDPKSPRPTEVISIFDLAKTSFLPGHAEQVMALVTKLHFDVNFPIPKNGMTVFLCACISGNKTLVSFLLEKGGDVSITNRDGDTGLYLATFTCAGSNNTDFSLLQMLISAGCDLNAQNHKGNTALHWAASKGDVNMIKFLLSCGADLYIKNNIGMYPIGMATNAGHLRAGKLLKINIPNDEGPWDMFEPNTPVKVRLGLMSPRRDHLALSPRPRMRLNFS